MGCRHSQYYGEGGEARVESLHYKQRRSTKNKRSHRHKKTKSSVSSGSSSQRKGSELSAAADHDVDDLRRSAASSLDREPVSREVEGEECDEGFHSVVETTRSGGGHGKTGKKEKKGKTKGWNKKKEERRVQQLFGAGHQHAARDALTLSVSSPDTNTNSSGGGGGVLSSTPSSDSLPARLLAHYKRAFPVWQAADYHFRQDGRGLTLSTLNGASLTCHCGKDVEPANGNIATAICSGDTAESSSISQQTSSSSPSSSTAAAVGTTGRQQCRRCSLAAAKRAGLLSTNNNGSLDGGSAAAAAADGADGDGVGGGGPGDNGAAASGALPEPGKLRGNVDAIANFLVLAALDLSAPASSVLIQNRKNAWIQLAGHPGAFAPAGPNTIWKKRISKENYETLAYTALKEFPQSCYITPIFYREVEYNGEYFIEMEDLLHHFHDPSIMDIKMGTRTFLEAEVKNPTLRDDLYEKMVKVEPHAPTDEEREQGAITKLRYMQFRERESSTASQGFRIEAIRMTGEPPNTNLKRVKTKEEVSHFIRKFVAGHEVVIPVLYRRLMDIREKFESISFFKSHEVIGSSLLIMYDRDNNAGVWMIDFAKTIPLQNITVDHRTPWELGNHEDGYLFGLDRLIEIFSDLSENISEGAKEGQTEQDQSLSTNQTGSS